MKTARKNFDAFTSTNGKHIIVFGHGGIDINCLLNQHESELFDSDCNLWTRFKPEKNSDYILKTYAYFGGIHVPQIFVSANMV